MGLFEGKKGLILGVANDRSIAWAIAQQIMDGGGECGFTHLPDPPGDTRQKCRRRVSLLTDTYDQAKFLVPMDISNDEDIAAVVQKTADEFGKIDFLLHSVAYALMDDLKRDTIATSRDGFKLAMEISAYSLLAIADATKDIMNEPASILAMTYFGGEKAVPGYNVMGVCKAASMHAFDTPPSTSARAAFASTRSAPDQSAHWPDAARASKTCCRSTSRSRRWAATSRMKRSAAPEPSSSPVCPMESPAKSSTSTAATTSWARRDACSTSSRRNSKFIIVITELSANRLLRRARS